MRKFLNIFCFMAALPVSAAVVTAQENRIIPSRIQGAPAHIIPMSSAEIADARMREILSAKLMETLTFEAENDDDFDHLVRLASLSYDEPADQTKGPEIRDEDFSKENPSQGSNEIPGAGEVTLNPDQMQAMALILANMNNPDFLSMIQSGMREKDPWVRDTAPEAHMSSAELPGANILLRGWSVAMRQDGTTRLFQDDNPRSEITLEPGLVIGALGAVVDIRQIGPEVLVTFENGDSISGRAEFSFSGIPPIPPLSQPGQPSQEMLLSAPAFPTISTSSN